jgi:3-deoxy-D-manno-octulosonic-acid transferase
MLIYRFLSYVLFPVFEIYIFWRAYKKKEIKERLRERFGRPTLVHPETPIIWIHAVSVGETNSSFGLVEELLKLFPQTSILFTTTTTTSASVISEKLSQFNGRVIHQFLPIDSYFCVKNFLNFWRPEAAIFVESEIWPNFLDVSEQMGISTFLVNGRISEKSATKWNIAKSLGFNVFDYFAAIFAQSEKDQERLQKLSSNEVLFYGNLKSQAQNLFFKPEKLEELKAQIGERKFWIAASTHKGEEEFVIKTHLRLKKEFPDLLTIIIPRHPNRAEEVKNLIKNINFAQRSENQFISKATEIYLADSLNEMGIFYRLGKFVFLGGSLFEIGGHNPFEVVRLKCVVISGRGVANNKTIYSKLEEERACIMIDSGDELPEVVKYLLENESVLEPIAKTALEVINGSGNIAEQIAKHISSSIN